MLTIFFDGACPLCSAEMQSLKNHDNQDLILLVDIHTPVFESRYPKISKVDAMRILHGTYEDKLLLGLEVTHRAWSLVGKGFWVAPLNWPVFKTISHWVYLGVAKYRQPISSLFARLFHLETKHCQQGVCFDKSTNANHRRK